MYNDPVCKKTLNEDDVKAKYTFDGKTYYFCCVDCQEKFASKPQLFVSSGLWQKLFKLFASPDRAEQH